MPPIITAQGLSKRYGAEPLFQDISFTVSEGERIGLIGPNGSGKSTLLEILYGRVKPDSGDVAMRKRTRLSWSRRIPSLPQGATIRSVIEGSLERAGVPERERAARMAETAGPRGLHGPRYAHGGAFRRLAQAPGDCRRAGAGPGHSAARRADQSSGSCRDRVARNGSAECGVRLRGGQPRPLFPGKRRHRSGRAQSHVRERLSARQRKLQHVSGGEGRIPARAAQAAGIAWKTACTRKWNGCAAAPRREPRNPRRASTKRTK